jgi:hypothetical protein
MAIGLVIKQARWYFPESKAKENFIRYSDSLFYLIGFFQVCLALTKKDIRDAFVEMWCCCRKHDNGVTRSGTFFGRFTCTTMRESYGPEDDGYDDEPPTVDNATSSAVNATVLNQDTHPNENDGNEGSTSFVESTKQNDSSIIESEGSAIDDIDGEERIGAENCSDINETNNETAMSKEDRNIVQV